MAAEEDTFYFFEVPYLADGVGRDLDSMTTREHIFFVQYMNEIVLDDVSIQSLHLERVNFTGTCVDYARRSSQGIEEQ